MSRLLGGFDVSRSDLFWLVWLGAFLFAEGYALLRCPEATLSAVIWRLTEGPVRRLVLGVVVGLIGAHLLAQEVYGGRP